MQRASVTLRRTPFFECLLCVPLEDQLGVCKSNYAMMFTAIDQNPSFRGCINDCLLDFVLLRNGVIGYDPYAMSDLNFLAFKTHDVKVPWLGI